MESILDWGIGGVIWFQQFSPTLDLPFRALTFLGNQEFLLLFLLLLYWCVVRRTGAMLIILFLFSSYLNTVAKVLAAQPRPYQYDPRVLQLCKAGGGGLPSGHTQNTVVVWGYLVYWFRRPWPWVIAGLLMIFIPLSRLYLGVHFPTDLLGGYLLGVALLFLYLWLAPHVKGWLERRYLLWHLCVAITAPALLILLAPGGQKRCISAAATLMGMGVGFALERRWVGFESGGLWWKRVFRFLVGAPLLFSLWLGLRAAFNGLEPEPIYRVIHYGLVGLGGGLGAPWVFLKLRLANPGQADDPSNAHYTRRIK